MNCVVLVNFVIKLTEFFIKFLNLVLKIFYLIWKIQQSNPKVHQEKSIPIHLKSVNKTFQQIFPNNRKNKILNSQTKKKWEKISHNVAYLTAKSSWIFSSSDVNKEEDQKYENMKSLYYNKSYSRDIVVQVTIKEARKDILDWRENFHGRVLDVAK